MSILYYIACKECKVVRDLDKFHRHRTVENRPDAISYAKDMVTEGDKGYRDALLVSFMSEHRGHECIFFHEDDKESETLIPFFNEEYKKDIDFWE